MSQVMLHHRMEDVYQHFAHRFTLNLASTMIYRVNLLHMFCHSWSNSSTRLKHRPIPRTMGCTRPWSRVEYAKWTFQGKVTTILHLYHVPSGFLFAPNNKDKDKRAEMLWEAKQWDAKNDWPAARYKEIWFGNYIIGFGNYRARFRQYHLETMGGN